jgi:hypothetical protein
MMISTRQPEVVVEYTAKDGSRMTKVFKDAYAARRFFVQKDKEGASPVVRKADRPSPTA